MERNENGTPVAPLGQERMSELGASAEACAEGENKCADARKCDTGAAMLSDSLPLAYAYVPWQKWRLLYSPREALANGTLFEELNKPIGVYGNEH